MFLAVHASVGALAGKISPDPITSFVLGFASHFLVDMVPHGDENMYEGYKNGERKKRALAYVAADSVATLVLIIAIFMRDDFVYTNRVFLGIMGGLVPDILVGYYELFHPKKLAKFHRFHMRNHHFIIKRLRKLERDIPLRYGLLMQAVVLGFLIRVIL